MSYFFRTGIVSTAAGLTVTCTVYGDDGVALVSQPPVLVLDFGNKAYGIRLTLADGQVGWLTITDGTLVWLNNISPPETENADAKTSSLPTSTQNADALLKRDWTAVTGEASRSVLNALRRLRNRVTRSGVNGTVTKEDDTAPAWTATINSDEIDPS